MDIDTEETDIDGEEDFNRKPMGAINPLLMRGVDHGGSSQYCKDIDHLHCMHTVDNLSEYLSFWPSAHRYGRL